MKELLLSPSIIIKLFVLLTFLHALLRLETKKKINKYLFYILTISVFAELVNSYLNMNHLSYGTFTTFNLVSSTILWFLILHMIFETKRLLILSIVIFSLFALYNLLFVEGVLNFNYYTLIFGAFLYILFFVFECFFQLKKDNFYFFQSNKYILILSPVIFFMGLLVLFIVKNLALSSSAFRGDIMLLPFVQVTVYLAFYLSLNYYILKER